MKYNDTTIIVPTLNEEKNIGKLLTILESYYDGVKITVVDDGSKDKTQDIVKKHHAANKAVSLIDRSKRSVKGLTASVVEGLQSVTTKYAIVIDADLQHPPEKIKDIHWYLEEGFDLVAGYRAKICIDWPWYRRIITKSGLALGKLRLLIRGAVCKDILSGYFGLTKELISRTTKNKQAFEMEGYKVLFDILKQLDKKTKIQNFPFEFDVRKEGHSKLSNKVMIKYLKSIFR